MALTSTYAVRGTFPGPPPSAMRPWALGLGPRTGAEKPTDGGGGSGYADRPPGLVPLTWHFRMPARCRHLPRRRVQTRVRVSWAPRASVIRLFAASACPSMHWAYIFSGTATPCPGLRRMESATCGCQFSPPVNDHQLDLAGALEDREDSGRSVSAGQRTVDPRGISTDPAPDFGGRRRFPAAPHMLPGTGGSPRKAPQTPGISCRQSIARRYLGGTFSLACQGTPPVRQWRTGGLHTGPTPRNAHGTLLAAVVPTRRRHGRTGRITPMAASPPP